jgi:hypothetical protein
MAAGAILPPLFFERRRDVSIFAPENGILRNIRNNIASIMRFSRSCGLTAGALSPTTQRPIPPKDI